MNELSAGKLTVRGSQFFAHLYELGQEDEIMDVIKSHKSSYKKAIHHCYALRFSNNFDQVVESFRDDGEVGRPGRILLEVLKKHSLKHHALVVSRIFGGVKLGVGGVSRAFRDAGETVVEYHKSSKSVT